MRSVCMCSSLRRWQPRTNALGARVGAAGCGRDARPLILNYAQQQRARSPRLLLRAGLGWYWRTAQGSKRARRAHEGGVLGGVEDVGLFVTEAKDARALKVDVALACT